MPWTHYRSIDPGAPVLNGTNGSLVALLDAILVNGYGAKPAAGWTKAFSDINRAAYKMGLGSSGFFLQVNDNNGSNPPRFRGFEEITVSIDGTARGFPNTSQVIDGLSFVKSATTDATPRPWVACADEKRIYLFAAPSDTNFYGLSSANTSGLMFGDAISNVPNDPYLTFAIGNTGSSLTGDQTGTMGVPSNTYSATQGHYICRNYLGVGDPVAGGSVSFRKVPTIHTAMTLSGGSSVVLAPYPSPDPLGMLKASDLLIIEAASGPGVIRGRIPGFCAILHTAVGRMHEEFTDTNGNTFQVVRVNAGFTLGGRALLQISGSVG